ncbi:MAG TPA: UvrD-helicase domain-containing protein, partial [Syntrophomonadaceae bacterium]|nr:UvrD-helicase domain-containing protein [Syntrophomonadaceae bacterium]
MDLSSLNSQQREAVEHMDGPCCVVAGAGSGKTRVLTYRVANLVERGIPAQNILAVTFTRKAAGEMQERLQPLIGDAALEDLNVGTFHSICYRILRDEWRASSQPAFEPAQEGWQKRTIKKILDDINLDMDISHMLGFISWQKNNLITPEMPLDLLGAPAFMEERLRQVYRLYEQAKQQERKLDFDDMLLWCYQMLKEDARIRSKYQDQFKYILVDEFQD